MGLKPAFLPCDGRAWPYILNDMSKAVEEEEGKAWLMMYAASWPGKAPRGHSLTSCFGTVPLS